MMLFKDWVDVTPGQLRVVSGGMTSYASGYEHLLRGDIILVLPPGPAESRSTVPVLHNGAVKRITMGQASMYTIPTERSVMFRAVVEAAFGYPGDDEE